MKFKIIFIRIFAACIFLLCLFLAWTGTQEQDSPKGLIKVLPVLAAAVLMFAGTFLPRMDSAGKDRIKLDFGKWAGTYFDESPRAKKHFYKGFCNWYGNNYAAAYYYMEKAADAAENPRAKARAYFFIGRCAKEEKKYGRAIENLQKAVRLDAAMPEAWNNLATVCFGIGRPEDGVRACETGIAYNPSYPLLYNTLGNYYYEAGLYDKALEKILIAEKLLPANASIVMNSALGFAALGNEAEAMRRYHRAAELGYEENDHAFQLITIHLARHRQTGEAAPGEY